MHREMNIKIKESRNYQVDKYHHEQLVHYDHNVHHTVYPVQIKVVVQINQIHQLVIVGIMIMMINKEKHLDFFGLQLF